MIGALLEEQLGERIDAALGLVKRLGGIADVRGPVFLAQVGECHAALAQVLRVEGDAEIERAVEALGRFERLAAALLALPEEQERTQ
jgi:hypothetical protein